MLWEESQLVVERINRFEATRTVLLQAAVASLFSKDGARQFTKLVQGMTKDGNEE